MNVRSVLGRSSRTTESDAGEGERRETPSKSRLVTFLQGATTFVVMFVVLYASLRWMLSTEERTE